MWVTSLNLCMMQTGDDKKHLEQSGWPDKNCLKSGVVLRSLNHSNAEKCPLCLVQSPILLLYQYLYQHLTKVYIYQTSLQCVGSFAVNN